MVITSVVLGNTGHSGFVQFNNIKIAASDFLLMFEQVRYPVVNLQENSLTIKPLLLCHIYQKEGE